jgi:hypothetical protein
MDSVGARHAMNSTELSPELQKLCERAAQEKDPKTLCELTERINFLLDKKFRGSKRSSSKDSDNAA